MGHISEFRHAQWGSIIGNEKDIRMAFKRHATSKIKNIDD